MMVCHFFYLKKPRDIDAKHSFNRGLYIFIKIYLFFRGELPREAI